MDKLILLTLIISSYAWGSQLPVIKNVYFDKMFGHLHQSSNAQSSSLKVLSCGDSLKYIYQEKDASAANLTKFNWQKLQIATYTGFVREDFLSSEPPDCFNKKYLKFVEQFKLEISDIYNWGRLNDQYVLGKSKVK